MTLATLGSLLIIKPLRLVMFGLLIAQSFALGQRVCPDRDYISVRSSIVKIPGNPRTIISGGKVSIADGMLSWVEREVRKLLFRFDKDANQWRPENLAEIAKKSGEEEPLPSVELTYAGMAENQNLHVFRLTVSPGEGKVDTSHLYLRKAD